MPTCLHADWTAGWLDGCLNYYNPLNLLKLHANPPQPIKHGLYLDPCSILGPLPEKRRDGLDIMDINHVRFDFPPVGLLGKNHPALYHPPLQMPLPCVLHGCPLRSMQHPGNHVD